MLNFILPCRQVFFLLETLKEAPKSAVNFSLSWLRVMAFFMREGSGLCARECLSVQ